MSAGEVIVVHVTIAAFNFFASIIQGVTGFGDAILLQILWFTAWVLYPNIYGNTPLGPEPVRAVALLMYVRIVFCVPLVAYLSFKDGIFSWTMTLAMAIPSTLSAVGGVFVFSNIHSSKLKYVLGISSLVFAGMYVLIIGGRYLSRQKRVRALLAPKSKPATIIGEEEAVEHRLMRDRANASPVVRHATPGGTRPSHDDDSYNNESHRTGAAAGESETVVEVRDHIQDEGCRGAKASITYLSAESGSPYTNAERQPRVIEEDNVPPLTREMLSPSGTLTYTHVRVNRNLDANGKIKLSTKIGAGVAAAVSGIMGSLTGVGGPPQIIFVLLFDVPQYIIRVNFCLQSIPSGAMRFVIAVIKPIFTWSMTPIFINSVIAGFIGVYVGALLGKMLGPTSYSVFVLVLLLLSSMTMITENVVLLIGGTLLSALITFCCAIIEYRRTHAQRDAIRAEESEIAMREQQQRQPEQTVRRTAAREERQVAADVFTNTCSDPAAPHARVRPADLARPPSLWATPNGTSRSVPSRQPSLIVPSLQSDDAAQRVRCEEELLVM